MAAQGLKSSQSKQCRRTRQRQQQTAGLRAVWPRSCSPAWPSGSLRRCPLIFPHCLSKESPAGPASGRDGISDSALLGFLDRHGGTFRGEKNTRKHDGCPVLLSLFKYGKPQKHIQRRGVGVGFSPCQTQGVKVCRQSFSVSTHIDECDGKNSHQLHPAINSCRLTHRTLGKLKGIVCHKLKCRPFTTFTEGTNSI